MALDRFFCRKSPSLKIRAYRTDVVQAGFMLPLPVTAILLGKLKRRGFFRAMSEASQDLPREIADRITKPFARFLKIEAASGILLLLAALAALGLAQYGSWGGAVRDVASGICRYASVLSLRCGTVA